MDSPRGMHVVGTPDSEVGCGRHAALRVPGREAADGAGLQGAASPARFSAAPRAGEALVATAKQRRPRWSPPDRAAPSRRSLTMYGLGPSISVSGKLARDSPRSG